MDTIALNEGSVNIVKDIVGENCRQLFTDFLENFTDMDGTEVYVRRVERLGETGVLRVDMGDVDRWNSALGLLIRDEFARVYPYLCSAASNVCERAVEVSLETEDGFVKLRELGSGLVGRLAKIRGQVVRTESVQPEVVGGVHVCVECGEKGESSKTCHLCGGRPVLDVGSSELADFQRIRIQETQTELPRGCIPRSLEVILRGEWVEVAQAGDRVELVGTVAVAEDRLCFVACNVKSGRALEEVNVERDLYHNLCYNLFPSIHGNDEVKRGIVLMLFGGVPKITPEGTRLRGNINVCIVGDPSTAKSQLLKHVEELSPRAVYTSGKSTTAAGLTAAVVRDEGHLVIEAGALMLADGGVCCIDEFDKIDQKDQVAIHEAMEQQTISIAKAGVKASLNARTSILAAANPKGGHYDTTKSLKRNINMSAPIMSRFDLFFILIDEYNDITDYAIANKIVQLHALKTPPRQYSLQAIRRHIASARQINPTITPEAQEYLVQQYKLLRQRDALAGHSSRVTVRQLESMIRLSEAMARMFLSQQVEPRHVKEAFRLISKSIVRVDHPDVLFQEEQMDDIPSTPLMFDAPSPGPSTVPSTVGGSRTVSISYEDYKQISNALITHIRRIDEMADFNQQMSSGVRKSELVAWYLEEIIGEIDSEEELAERKIMLERLIDRLIHSDRILIQLSLTDINDAGVITTDDPFIVVHPNYIVDT